MPLYEFRCSDCSHDFEELVRSMAAVDQVKCPSCGSGQVHKRVSSFAARVTGAGGGPFSAASDSSCATGST